MKSKTIARNFLFLVILNPLVCLWLLLPMRCFTITCVGHLENTGSQSYSDLLNSDTIQYIIFKTITVVNVITNIIRKIFRYWEAVNSWCWILIFQNSDFYRRAYILSWVIDIISCFLEWQTHFTRFQERICQVPVSE